MDTYRRKIIAGALWVEEAYVSELENMLEKARSERDVARAKIECKDEEIARLSALITHCEPAPKIERDPALPNIRSQPHAEDKA